MQTSQSRSDFNSINLPRPEKETAYARAAEELDAILGKESHAIMKMATINTILREALPYYFWTGFYLVNEKETADGQREKELVVGPYQGTLGCLHIAFGKGVCGTAAETRETQVVPDVHKFAGHIACDSRSKSEIVVPVSNQAGDLIAVFDVDSTVQDSFDQVDKEWLEKILHQHFATSALS